MSAPSRSHYVGKYFTHILDSAVATSRLLNLPAVTAGVTVVIDAIFVKTSGGAVTAIDGQVTRADGATGIAVFGPLTTTPASIPGPIVGLVGDAPVVAITVAGPTNLGFSVSGHFEA